MKKKKTAALRRVKPARKKGMEMSADMRANPGSYLTRACVAYDKDGLAEPRLYVMVGNHDHSNEHDIRKVYARSAGTNYYDARVVLYSTYAKRVERKKLAERERLAELPN